MKLHYLLPTTLALLFGAAAAHANDPNKHQDKTQESTSATQTGTQSQHPATAGAHGRQNAALQQQDREAFARLDTNGDGYLSDTEIGADTSLDIVFNDVDRDSDSRISRGEWSSRDAKGQDKEQMAEDDY